MWLVCGAFTVYARMFHELSACVTLREKYDNLSDGGEGSVCWCDEG